MLPVLGFVDESSRVFLQPIRAVDGSDYINASFIDVSSLSLPVRCITLANIAWCTCVVSKATVPLH